MHINCSSLIDTSVWQEQHILGRVWRVAFDLSNGNVLGLLLDPTTVVYTEHILELHSEQITVSGSEKIHPGSLVDKTAKAPVHVQGAKITTKNGSPFGTVREIIITFPLPQLASIVAGDDEGERLVSRSHIISMSHDRVVISDDLVKKFDWNGADVAAIARPTTSPALTSNRS